MRVVPATILAATIFVAAVPVVGAVLFLPVIFLAGPHSDLLPGAVQGVVIVVAWVLVVAIPAWVARWIFRRSVAGGPRRPPRA